MGHHDLTRVTVSSMTREATRVLTTGQELATHPVTHQLHLTLDQRARGSTGTSLPPLRCAGITGTSVGNV